MDWYDWVGYWLIVIGALNWGLYAINPQFDLVALIFGGYSPLSRAVYGIVGIAGAYAIAVALKLLNNK